MPLAAVAALDALLAALVVVTAVLVGYGLRRFRARGPKGRLRPRLLPLVLLVLTVLLIGFLVIQGPSASDPNDVLKTQWAQIVSALAFVAVTFALWAASPLTWAACEDTTVEEAGEEQIIEEGEWVTATIAKRPEAAGRFSVRYEAGEAFELDGETVPKGRKLARHDAESDAAKGHVRVIRVATDRITFIEVKEIEFVQGQALSEGEAKLLPEGKAERGLAFAPGRLFVGKDGRWSTSKLTALIWTLGVAWALLTLMIATQGLEVPLELKGVPLELKGGSSFTDLPFPPQYYLLLGGPFAAAVLAKTFTSAKVEEGTLIKLDKPAETNPIAGLQEVLSNDANSNDLVDTQYFLFNVLAFGLFLVLFIDNPRSGLPDLPEVLYGLTSAAALAYTAKKGLEREVPLVLSVSPSTVRVGETVEVWGRNLVTAGVVPDVQIGGRAASQVTVVAGGIHDDGDRLRVVVPELAAGDVGLVVTPRGGRPTAEFGLTSQIASVTAVAPEPIPIRVGQRIVITGEGLGGDPGEVLLGSKALVVRGWSPSSIVAELDVTATPVVAAGSVVLEVRVGKDIVARNTKAEGIVLEDVQPRNVTAKAGTTLVATGRGFSAYPLRVTLGGAKLSVTSLTDTQMTFELSRRETYPTGPAQTLLVAATDLPYEAHAEVKVTKAPRIRRATRR